MLTAGCGFVAGGRVSAMALSLVNPSWGSSPLIRAGTLVKRGSSVSGRTPREFTLGVISRGSNRRLLGVIGWRAGTGCGRGGGGGGTGRVRPKAFSLAARSCGSNPSFAAAVRASWAGVAGGGRVRPMAFALAASSCGSNPIFAAVGRASWAEMADMGGGGCVRAMTFSLAARSCGSNPSFVATGRASWAAAGGG